MKDKNLFALGAMFVLTMIGAWMSGFSRPAFLLLLVFGIKFLLVAVFFMDLRHAHPIWRFALTFLICLIFGAVLVVRA